MAEEKKNELQDAKTLGRRAFEFLKEHGFPAILAAGIVAAGYGLLVYLGVFSLSGCTASYTKLPDGTVKAQGAVVKPVHVTK